MTNLAKESNNVAYVAAIGRVTERYNDAQTMLLQDSMRVFTLPARIAAIGYQNKAVIYDLLFKGCRPEFAMRQEPSAR